MHTDKSAAARRLSALPLWAGVAVFVFVPVLLWVWIPKAQRRWGSWISPEVRTVGIARNELGLRKVELINDEGDCDRISDVRSGDFDPQPGLEIVFADCKAAWTADTSGKILKQVKFEKSLHAAVIVTMGGRGENLAFAESGNMWTLRTLDEQGHIRWQSGEDAQRRPNPPVLTQMVADVDGDGTPEFLVWTQGAGLRLMDAAQKTLWETDPDEHVISAVFLPDPSGRTAEVGYVTDKQEWVRRNWRGDLLQRVRPDVPALNYPSVIAWPAGGSEPHLLQFFHDTITILDKQGSPVARLKAPLMKRLLMHAPLRATWVRFAADRPYLVVPCQVYNEPRLVLHIYDEDGHLVYQETLKGSYAGVGVLDLGAGQPQALLLGGEGKVLKYALGR